MAGSFPDVPAPRMSYDKDGSVLVKYNNIDDEVITIPALSVTKLNSEDNTESFIINTQPSASEFYLGILFPEERSVDGIFISAVTPAAGAADQFMDIHVEYSTNTTNFIDGTWTTAFEGLPFALKTKTNYRSSIINLTIASAIAIRVVDRANSGNTGRIKNLHLYGSILDDSPRLAFWHPTDDLPLPGAWLDFGNVKQTTSVTKTFRIKNLSTSETATNIRLSTEALTDTLPTNVGQHTLSYNGGNFDSAVFIPSLAPEQISQAVNYKRATLSNAVISTWSVRVLADIIGGWA